jgi:hypothetical protein
MDKKKYIIGLGCSWTQGEGGYPDEIWQQYNGRVNLRCVPDEHLRKYEHENSWVNVLCKEHFQDHIPMNLGVRGIGNTAAVHQLHFCDKIDWNNSTGYIVLLLSGFERLDFFQQGPRRSDPIGDGYSNGNYAHYKWRPAWPIAGEGGEEEPLWAIYGKMLWSEQFVASNQMMALLNLQTFAKAHGYKVVVANAFNQYRPSIKNYLIEQTGPLALKFDWKTYLHEKTEHIAMVQKLVELDGYINPKDWGGHYQAYDKRSWPAKYLTNCNHPTIEGYRVIAKEIANFIRNHLPK